MSTRSLPASYEYPYTYLHTYFNAEVESKKKKEAEEIKSKAKPRTIWDKPDIFDVTSNSLTLRWKPSSVPQYAVQVGRLFQNIFIISMM